MARTLPRLIRIALALAWQADRTALLRLFGLQLAAGVLTAAALHLTRAALTVLFAAGAPLDRLDHAEGILLALAAVAAARSLASAGTLATTARLGPAVDSRAELAYLEAATRVPLAAYDDPSWCDHGEAANRAAKDAHTVLESLTAVTGAALSITAAASILTALDPLLLPLLLLGVLPGAWAAARAAQAAHRADRHAVGDRRTRHILMYLAAGRNTALDVRAGTMRPWLLSQYRTVSSRLEDHTARIGAEGARCQLAGDILAGTAALVVYGALLWLTVHGRIPTADAATALIAVQTSRALLTGMATGLTTTYRMGLYLGDWASFLSDAKARTTLPVAPAPVPAHPAVIRAENVTFAYEGAAAPVLTDISLTVRRGEILAIVGHNGAGKSTLAKLLAGLYTPTSGTITWDSTDLTTVDPDELFSRLAMLPQDIARWQATVRENISLGQGDQSDDAVLAAARAGGAAQVIDALPDGLDTHIRPAQSGGRDLSGGQWQRIAAARAYARKDAPLLICDEPTSALDPRAEQAAYDRIRELAADRTVILITHRLGSTQHADRIVVLDRGRILEEGTHTSLLAADGEYATTWTTQARAYAPAYTPVGSASERAMVGPDAHSMSKSEAACARDHATCGDSGAVPASDRAGTARMCTPGRPNECASSPDSGVSPGAGAHGGAEPTAPAPVL
ncbi:ABC transporter ATP-binding protein [Streptomyces katsurahamanus]|uniref:ABC transporter ATP-binding protein n=1 Tax=Streptomyces katsurahamanus TaxID=2577098 RepID=A0ABW9NZ20_9ACTN|nr:ABC transporter ATP-binding protein [Streptomyces katsurahamanus]MQS38414.1 ABC transporter ATP-binding protein [Streptomyces katsurahamanus]